MAGLGRGLSVLLDGSRERAERAERRQQAQQHADELELPEVISPMPLEGIEVPTKGSSPQRNVRRSLPPEIEDVGEQVMMIELSKLKASPYQPRTEFNSDAIGELAASIREHGLLEPLLVRRAGDDVYQIICGERRYRACCVLELKRVPCLVREVIGTQAYALALIENIQREDLNPLEQAAAMQRMLDECKITQEELANTLGKSRSSVTNILRLNELERAVKELVSTKALTAGHAKVLLTLEGELQVKTAKLCVERGYTVRELEKFIKELKEKGQADEVSSPLPPVILSEHDLDVLSTKLYGAKVQIKNKNDHQGRITLSFDNSAQLKSILQRLGIKPQAASSASAAEPVAEVAAHGDAAAAE